MACGIPVITTLDNGAVELIKSGENGYVLDSSNPLLCSVLEDQLASLRDEAHRYQMSKRALNTTVSLTPENNAKETIEILKHINFREKKI